MEHLLRIISQLRKFFKEDKVSLFYHGDFDDYFTEKIIMLIGYEGKKKIRGNLAFVIAENFQNIVRHKNIFLGEGNENVFSIRGGEDYMHVFSSNLVVSDVKDHLFEELTAINSMDPDELKRMYMKILEKGELNEKGGAGMGLLEMARRSGNPVQFEFDPFQNDVYAFNMQVDFQRIKGEGGEIPISVEENSLIKDLTIENDIVFIYKGIFSEAVMGPILPMIQKCISREDIDELAVLKIAKGLIQNIESYGMADENGDKRGIFAMIQTENGYYLCSGNYTQEDIGYMRDMVEEMNLATANQLFDINERVQKRRLSQGLDTGRIGLLDIRRTSGQEIDLILSEDTRGKYAMVGALVTSESGK